MFLKKWVEAATGSDDGTIASHDGVATQCHLGKDRVDGLGKTLQAIDHRDQDIADAAVPELRALGLLDPQTEVSFSPFAGSRARFRP
jgi:hypothetical protein